MKQLSEKQEINLLIVAWAAALGSLKQTIPFTPEQEERTLKLSVDLKFDAPEMKGLKLVPEILDRLEAAIAKRKEMK